MFAQYSKLILDDYHKKREAGKLPMDLMHPTITKIKNACLVTCSKKFSLKDGRLLEDFFGEGNNEKILLEKKKKTDPGKFKPVLNFINSKTSRPIEKHVELLAWLIDFQPRPFDYAKKYDAAGLNTLSENETEGIIGDSSNEQNGVTETEASGRVESTALNKANEIVTQKKRLGFKAMAVILLLAILSAAGVFFWQKQNKAKPVPLKSSLSTQSCMYWNGDHYEQISCNQKIDNILVIAFDSATNLLKKINRPDTITEKDIGKVHYIKINSTLEFYTTQGFYPLDLNLRLKPLTPYIYDKYIVPLKR